MLGTRGHASWLDVSDYVVHFTKGNDDTAYQTKMAIIWEGLLRRGPESFGIARRFTAIAETQRAVCFSEIPLGFLHRIVERRGTKYGVGFHKTFVQRNGAAPVWYVEHGSPQHAAIKAQIDRAAKPIFNMLDPIWSLTPFIDAWADGEPYAYDFRWEREWRIASDLSFTPDDVAFLFLPEDLHQAGRDFFAEHYQGGTGPAYFCPFIDPTWSVDRVREGLEDVPGIWRERERT
jgi:hypothetical protein